jgi:hypothetical protein
MKNFYSTWNQISDTISAAEFAANNVRSLRLLSLKELINVNQVVCTACELAADNNDLETFFHLCDTRDEISIIYDAKI